MERLKQMKNSLMAAAESQMGNLSNADTKELGQVIDMIKDLEEAIYYCSISTSMEENKEEEKHRDRYMRHYQERERYIPIPIPMMENYDYNSYYRDMDRDDYGKMYYQGRVTRDNTSMRDAREGRSPNSRRNYIEAKELHQGKEIQMKELDKYIQELGQDITEMIQDASPEEKQMLSQKISLLATKIK